MSGILIVENEQKAEAHANDYLMAKTASEVLMRAYPGWLWGVHIDGRTGMCDIKNFNLSGQRGYRLKLHDIYSASAFERDVMRAGGEILERFKQPRGKFDPQRWSELALSPQGIPIGDFSSGA